MPIGRIGAYYFLRNILWLTHSFAESSKWKCFVRLGGGTLQRGVSYLCWFDFLVFGRFRVVVMFLKICVTVVGFVVGCKRGKSNQTLTGSLLADRPAKQKSTHHTNSYIPTNHARTNTPHKGKRGTCYMCDWCEKWTTQIPRYFENTPITHRGI